MNASLFLQSFYSSTQTAIVEKFSHKAMLNMINSFDAQAKLLPLKRDQHAYKMMRETVLHSINVYHTSAAYVYQGQTYSVQKLLKTKLPALSVEHLYTLNLNQDEWDKMERGTVWNVSAAELAFPITFIMYSDFHKKEY